MMKKRILLIAPDFFNYYKVICSSLESDGWEVAYLSDRPPVGSLAKIGIRKARFLFHGFLNSYYRQKLQAMGRFDRILIIKGEGITPKSLALLREINGTAKITLYLWDGIKNVPGGERLSRLVDDVYTFDPEDAKAFGFKLQPLFYVNNEQKTTLSAAPRYLISFVGSIHSDRLQVISRVRKVVPADGMFVFVYFPSKLLYYFRKFFDFSFGAFSASELSLTSISKNAVEDVFRFSYAVLDIQHPKQTGLTMRTMETLALGKKLVTTNPTVVQYPFYSPKNICVVDRMNPVIPASFFEEGVDESSVQAVQDYELRKWTQRVVGDQG